MMLAGLSFLTGGMLLGGAIPLYSFVMAALFLSGLGKSVYDPACQAYIGDRVPYQRRGQVIGILEMSWAGSTLIGIPLIAILIDRLNWRAPFFFLAALGLVSILAVGILIPGDKKTTPARQTTYNIRQSWQRLLREQTTLGTLGFSFLVSVANDNLFVVFGIWLESAFNLSVLAIGFGTIAIGVAELGGELTTAFWADRFGLKR